MLFGYCLNFVTALVGCSNLNDIKYFWIWAIIIDNIKTKEFSLVNGNKMLQFWRWLTTYVYINDTGSS